MEEHSFSLVESCPYPMDCAYKVGGKCMYFAWSEIDGGTDDPAACDDQQNRR